MSERVVSVESDPETLGRAGREGEKARNGGETKPPMGDYYIRYYARDCRYKLSCRKIEGGPRPPAFSRAVTTTCSCPVM